MLSYWNIKLVWESIFLHKCFSSFTCMDKHDQSFFLLDIIAMLIEKKNIHSHWVWNFFISHSLHNLSEMHLKFIFDFGGFKVIRKRDLYCYWTKSLSRFLHYFPAILFLHWLFLTFLDSLLFHSTCIRGSACLSTRAPVSLPGDLSVSLLSSMSVCQTVGASVFERPFSRGRGQWRTKQ